MKSRPRPNRAKDLQIPKGSVPGRSPFPHPQPFDQGLGSRIPTSTGPQNRAPRGSATGDSILLEIALEVIQLFLNHRRSR